MAVRFSQDHGSGNRAAVLMATCLILLLGAIGCTTIALVADPKQPLSTLIQAGGAILAITFLIWILRDKPRENRAKIAWSWLGRRRKRKIEYRARAKLPPEQRTAPPAPPTAAAIRELGGGTSTWVPSSKKPPLTEPGCKLDTDCPS